MWLLFVPETVFCYSLFLWQSCSLWVKQSWKLGTCCQVLSAFYYLGNVNVGTFKLTIYTGLVSWESDDSFREILVYPRGLSALGLWINFQKSLAWQDYQKALTVYDKLCMLQCSMSHTCPKYMQNAKIIRHPIVQYSSVVC